MQDHIVTQQERLTAYALNELDGAERAALDTLVKNDPDAQRYVEEVRATAAMLETELKQERLDELARTLGNAKVAQVAVPVAVLPRRSRSNRFIAYATVSAALIALGFVVFNNQVSSSHQKFAASSRTEPECAIVMKASPTIDGLKYSSGNVAAKKRDVGDEDDSVAAGEKNFQGTRDSESAKNDGGWGAGKAKGSFGNRSGKKIEVLPEIQKQAEIGDHFETRNYDKPDAKSAYGTPDSSAFHSVPGLEDKTGSKTPVTKDALDTIVRDDEKKHSDTSKRNDKEYNISQRPSQLPSATGYALPNTPATTIDTTKRPPEIAFDKTKPVGQIFPVEPSKLPEVVTIAPPAVKKPAELPADGPPRTDEFKIKPIPTEEPNGPTIGKELNIRTDAPSPTKRIPVEPSKLPEVVTIAPPAVKKPAPIIGLDVAVELPPAKISVVPSGGTSPIKPSADKINDTTARGYWAYIENANPTPTIPNTGETYAVYPQSGFESVRTAPLSTFSADVDSASFSNVRRFLTSNQLPPVDAVRIEELINYFKYHYETIKSDDPFGVNVEAAACPWNASHRLVRVAIKAQELAAAKRPAGNFVFLIDVSGSMDEANRLPLVKEGLKALVRKLDENDRVAIVTYAGQSGVALHSTNCTDKSRIIGVIDSLVAKGGTNGGEGIQTAYMTAKTNFIQGGVNRIILATDGDFNMGVSTPNELVKMIEGESKTNICLTALGYGMGNLKDAMLQRLADAGHGNYAYVDSAEESRKVLIEQMNGTLVTVAKDVKFQVEFNPANAQAYRLIGYEKRALAAQDFNNDAKDAGNVGAGHTVTAFYEIVPTNASQPGVDPLKYQSKPAEPPVTAPLTADGASPELLTLKIRYKQPEGTASKRLEFAFTDKGAAFEQASADFKFGSAVALFGQILKQSPHAQNATMRRVIELADDNRGTDEGGYRKDFIQLARKAAELRGER